MKSLVLLLALLTLVAGTASAAPSPDVEAQLAELRERLDALELENETLRGSISKAASEAEGPLLNAGDQIADSPTASVLEPHLDELESELAATAPACLQESEPKNDLSMTGKWNHGLEFTTKDKKFRVHVGGRTQFDTSWYSADQNVQENIERPYENGVDFRRGRIRIDGTMYYTMDWAVEYDFFNSFEVDDRVHTVTAPTDLWWTFREVPCVGNIRIGNQKQPIGFEHLVSSRFLPFMERSYNQDAFFGGVYNGFLPGIAAFDNWGDDDLGLWHVGVFKPTEHVFASSANSGDCRSRRPPHTPCLV